MWRIKKMTKQTYRLDVSKIKTLKDARNVFDLMKLVGYYDPEDPEDEHYHLREYFTILQGPQGLTFSAPRKSIKELQQELDEKIDKLIEDTKNRFKQHQIISERIYNTKFDRIIDNFEQAKKFGSFPQPIKYVVGTGLCANNDINHNFIIRQGSKHSGYYTFGNRQYFKYYMPDKPNAVYRFFMNKLLGFVWVDEKNV